MVKLIISFVVEDQKSLISNKTKIYLHLQRHKSFKTIFCVYCLNRFTWNVLKEIFANPLE